MQLSKSDLIRTAIYLPPDLHEALRELAFRKKTTMSDLIRQAITAWLDREIGERWAFMAQAPPRRK